MLILKIVIVAEAQTDRRDYVGTSCRRPNLSQSHTTMYLSKVYLLNPVDFGQGAGMRSPVWRLARISW